MDKPLGPLSGIRVLEVAMYHNGPATGYMLGDLGAEVIKIEPPVTGDYQRGVQGMYDVNVTTAQGVNVIFETANRNKRSVILDLKNQSGKAAFHRLVAKSDVFITNFTKRVIRELGIDYAALKQHNPRLIYAATTAFGSKGPLSENRGYDMVAQALSGAMWLFGDRDSTEPSTAIGALFDQVAASMLAYGITAALLARERTGKGQEVESSLLAAAIHMQVISLNTFLWRGRQMARFSRKRCRNPLVNYYQCADGKWLLLSEPQSGRYWHDFCEALGILDIENDERFSTADARRQNYAEVIAMLDRVLATKPRDEWLSIFKNHRFVYSPIYDYTDVIKEPQVLENQYIMDMKHPIMGDVKTVGMPCQFSETPGSIQSAAPEFGAHTEEVLTEIAGYTWDEIASLREQGAFG